MMLQVVLAGDAQQGVQETAVADIDFGALSEKL
jgi:hypothetical protein